ncbi:MAG TPA: thermonuclease family protein [Candidatus Nitrosocosmicus sp.]|nr:thermonuclease family protein [Candidatus Nitrosocosmicus sp.]
MTKKQFRIFLTLLFLIATVLAQALQKNIPTKSKAVQPTVPFISITPSLKQKEYAHVVKVVDGDTIEIIASGSSERRLVRYIGIDTPETHHPKLKVQCYGKEATQKNTELVLEKDIYMIKDISETDRYGRLLRYVFIPNPESTQSAFFVNEYLVREGYAHAATFPPDVAYQELFQQAQENARIEKKGLWGTCHT